MNPVSHSENLQQTEFAAPFAAISGLWENNMENARVTAKELNATKEMDKVAVAAVNAIDWDKLPEKQTRSDNPKPYKTTGVMVESVMANGFRYNVQVTINRFATGGKAAAGANITQSELKTVQRAITKGEVDSLDADLRKRYAAYATQLAANAASIGEEIG